MAAEILVEQLLSYFRITQQPSRRLSILTKESKVSPGDELSMTQCSGSAGAELGEIQGIDCRRSGLSQNVCICQSWPLGIGQWARYAQNRGEERPYSWFLQCCSAYWEEFQICSALLNMTQQSVFSMKYLVIHFFSTIYIRTIVKSSFNFFLITLF
jgi:hypothetical protein